MHFPLDLRIGSSDLPHLGRHPRIVKRVLVDSVAGALSLDPAPVILVPGIRVMRSVWPIQRRWNARSLRANKILVGTISNSRDTESRMDAVYVRQRSSSSSFDSSPDYLPQEGALGFCAGSRRPFSLGLLSSPCTAA